MRLWFDPERGNPNDAVAKWKAEEVITRQMKKLNDAESSSAGIFSLYSTVTIFVPFTAIIYKAMMI